MIRDLTALPIIDPIGRYADKIQFLSSLCAKLLDPSGDEIFLIAGNDGQLVETLHRLRGTPEVSRVRSLVETLLVEDRRESEGVPLKLFNSSRIIAGRSRSGVGCCFRPRRLEMKLP